MYHRILAISGKMYSGKDSFAATFLEVAKASNVPFVRVAFADALKAEVAAKHGITVAELEANKPQYRPELIEWGQVRRAEDPLYWVKRTLERAQTTNIVIPDMRFPNEVDTVKAVGGKVMRVESLASEREQRGKVIDDYATEQQLDQGVAWDYFLHNNGTLRAFQEAAREEAARILTDFGFIPIV